MKKTILVIAIAAFSFAATGTYACSLTPKVQESKPFVLAANPAYV